MADIFVSYARADRETVERIVALLEAQGWSVWWDTRIDAGERWDEVIEREIKTAGCIVVVWTPQSISRQWVLEEAHYGRDRGLLVPILIGVDRPPFGFSLIQARNLAGWDGSDKAATAAQFLADVRHKLNGTPPHPSSPQQVSPPPTPHARDVAEALDELFAVGVKERNRLLTAAEDFAYVAERKRLVSWSNRVVEEMRNGVVGVAERSRFKTLDRYTPEPMGTGPISEQQMHIQTMWTEKLKRLRPIIDRIGT